MVDVTKRPAQTLTYVFHLEELQLRLLVCSDLGFMKLGTFVRDLLSLFTVLSKPHASFRFPYQTPTGMKDCTVYKYFQDKYNIKLQ